MLRLLSRNGTLTGRPLTAMIVLAASLALNAHAHQPENAKPTTDDKPEGDMVYGQRPINLEVLVQVNLDTGEARLSPESALHLQRFRDSGLIDIARSVDIELHPALIEQGVLGSRGVSPEIRVRKAGEAIESVMHLPLGFHNVTVRKSPEAIGIYGENTSVARVRLGWLSQPTLARILYVTDRSVANDAPGHLAYGSGETDHLSYGWSTIEIERHLPRPAAGQWSWVTRWLKSDPKPTSAERLTSVPLEGFKQLASVLTDNLKRTKEDEILVYVHGFNTSYDQVVEDATILGYLTKFPGPVIAYSWASRGEVVDYDSDYEVATRTTPRLAQFLAAVKGVRGVKRVHVVAHSMGSRVLFWALQRSPNLRLNEVVMVAGDVAREDFKQYFAPDVLKTADRFTVYSTRTDFALFTSSKLHGEPRVGYGAPPAGPFILKGLEAVDATDVVTDILAHGYHLNSKLPQTDILAVLRGDAVDRRGCVEWDDPAKKELLRYTCH